MKRVCSIVAVLVAFAVLVQTVNACGPLTKIRERIQERHAAKCDACAPAACAPAACAPAACTPNAVLPAPVIPPIPMQGKKTPVPAACAPACNMCDATCSERSGGRSLAREAVRKTGEAVGNTLRATGKCVRGAVRFTGKVLEHVVHPFKRC